MYFKKPELSLIQHFKGLEAGFRAEWSLGDKLHNEDGPAVITSEGRLEWWLKGMRHKENGPAVIFPDGTQIWYQHGKRHRYNAPAIINDNRGEYQWWEHGKFLDEFLLPKLLPDGRVAIGLTKDTIENLRPRFTDRKICPYSAPYYEVALNNLEELL